MFNVLGRSDTSFMCMLSTLKTTIEKLLGYRAMNQKLRTEYSIYVPCHLVHNVTRDVDLEGIAATQVKNKT